MREAVVILCLSVLAACGGENKSEAPPATPTAEVTAAPTVQPAPPPPPAPRSLYDRLGGDAGIGKLVDASLAGIKADKRVARYLPRDAKKLAELRDDLVSQIGAGAGGPASTRKDPRLAVASMKLKAKDFDVIVEDIGKAANDVLADAEAKAVVDALTGMKDDLVAGAKR